ncbi:MAG: fructose bisphosphate aldolase [Ferrimicrobium sp.]|jgi:fructose-bisphosphate aldolase class I|uniref:fructose-bisphosphate aldolase n=1 Tax=Ferrimicrobium acidiphilum TaxID=121039 RepID=A0ABV3Y3T3_9ACTN|nr:fructose bisphosphate aldolase [Ferrimicrobium sp.]
MNREQLEQMRYGSGFIAALDQSGGSTPSALAHYGIPPEAYNGDVEMLNLIHEMRARIMTDPSFRGDKIIGAILFEDTMDRQVAGLDTANYLWSMRRVVPFVKVDKGLAAEQDGVRCMNPIPGLEALMERALAHGIFGTKMRSFIRLANPRGVRAIVEQQFEVGRTIVARGLVPILEPEIDITSPEKRLAESLLRDALLEGLGSLSPDELVMLKLTLPEDDDYYRPLIEHPNVVRVVALSGGYSRDEATARLARNHGMIASFSRALTEGLTVDMSDAAFEAEFKSAVEQVFAASIT